jgi:hypothetical protein
MTIQLPEISELGAKFDLFSKVLEDQTLKDIFCEILDREEARRYLNRSLYSLTVISMHRCGSHRQLQPLSRRYSLRHLRPGTILFLQFHWDARAFAMR